MKNIRDAGFDNLVDGTYDLAEVDGRWSLVPAIENIDNYSREIEISTIDSSTKSITTRVSWLKTNGQESQIEMTSYLSLWTSHSWHDSTSGDFNNGTLTNTITTITDGGEVELGSIVYADWCSPDDTMTEYDMPGSGIASSITAIPGELFL